jgi:hypothetical protein
VTLLTDIAVQKTSTLTLHAPDVANALGLTPVLARGHADPSEGCTTGSSVHVMPPTTGRSPAQGVMSEGVPAAQVPIDIGMLPEDGSCMRDNSLMHTTMKACSDLSSAECDPRLHFQQSLSSLDCAGALCSGLHGLHKLLASMCTAVGIECDRRCTILLHTGKPGRFRLCQACAPSFHILKSPHCVQELPISAGPYPEAPTLMGTPAAPSGIRASATAAPAATPTTAPQSTVELDAIGRDDVLPTPGFFQGPGTGNKAIDSPVTPEDAPFKPFCFSKSAGSQFATPEVPIHSGMTPMTTADSRHAQKHIPAWNRIVKLIEKQHPLVARQVQALAAMPGSQPAWARTPYMLLHSVCSTKGWELSVRHESASRIGAESSVIATVNIPAVADSGQTFTSVGKNQGAALSLRQSPHSCMSSRAW